MNSDKPVTVFLVEDDETDRELIARCFRKNSISNELKIAQDGAEALAILRGTTTEEVKRPYLVLLDLNMPRMGGIEFLKALRQDSHIKDSIVFVLTTSDSDLDKSAAYDLNVAGYIVKENAGGDFQQLADLLIRYERLNEFPTAHVPLNSTH